uniref:BPTI/Kunitz inhibitor domain-containing protein n=1 Tax=Podarcis muralis TaxID=64176 RepID=A0A670IFZ9_PODMU
FQSISLLPPQRGNCLALFIRWYYNPRVGRCLVFVYGGCLGNANNFHSRSACERRCMRPGKTPRQTVRRRRREEPKIFSQNHWNKWSCENKRVGPRREVLMQIRNG